MTGRRRGEALEHALLEAAWAELTEKGYAQFTIDALAARDTGSLRGDILALLHQANATRVELTAMVSVPGAGNPACR